MPWPEVVVREHQFDKDHNSYFHLGRQLRDRPAGGQRRPANPEEVARLTADLTSGERARQLAAIRQVPLFRDLPQSLLETALQVHQETKDAELRAAIEQAGRQLLTPQASYRPDEVARIRELSELRETNRRRVAAEPGGVLRLSLPVAANGANFVVIEPAEKPQAR